MQPIDTVSHALSESKDALTTHPTDNLMTGSNHELAHALNDAQGLLGLPLLEQPKVKATATT